MNEKTRIILIAGAVLVLLLLIVVLVPTGSGNTPANDLTAEEEELVRMTIEESEAAIEEFKEQGEDAETIYTEYLILATAYRRLGNFSQAEEAYSAALEYNTAGDTRAWTGLYDLALLEEDFERAEEVLTQAMEAQPENTLWWEMRLKLAREQMNLEGEELEALHEESLEATGRATGMLVLYANFLEREGRYDEALALWEEAAAKNPGVSIFTENAARVRALVGSGDAPAQ